MAIQYKTPDGNDHTLPFDSIMKGKKCADESHQFFTMDNVKINNELIGKCSIYRYSLEDKCNMQVDNDWKVTFGPSSRKLNLTVTAPRGALGR